MIIRPKTKSLQKKIEEMIQMKKVQYKMPNKTVKFNPEKELSISEKMDYKIKNKKNTQFIRIKLIHRNTNKFCLQINHYSQNKEAKTTFYNCLKVQRNKKTA